MAFNIKQKIPEDSIGKGVEKLECLYVAGESVKWRSRCGKQFGSSSKSWTQNYNMDHQSHSKYIPQRNKMYSHIKTWMFIASLKDGDSPVIPSTAECINSHIYTAEYYSAIKRNEVLICAITWTLKHHAKWKKPDTQVNLCYDSFKWNAQRRQIQRHRGWG